MDHATANGYLEVLEVLHGNRIGTCSPAAMVGAARSGYFDVVELLYKNCNVIYSARVMEGATRNEHLKAAEFLFSIRQAGSYLGDGLRYAAKHGHYRIVKLLCDQDSAQGILATLRAAVFWGCLEIVKLLHSKLQPEQSAYPALRAAAIRSSYQPDIVTFLCENQQCEPTCFLKLAVADGDAMLLGDLLEYASVDELSDMMEFAFEQNQSICTSELASRIREATSES